MSRIIGLVEEKPAKETKKDVSKETKKEETEIKK